MVIYKPLRSKSVCLYPHVFKNIELSEGITFPLAKRFPKNSKGGDFLAKKYQRDEPETIEKDFTLDEIKRGIEKILRRIADVRQLEINQIKHNDQKKDNVEFQIIETIREVFGEQSPEFKKNKYHSIWKGSHIIGDSDINRQRYFMGGIVNTITMLEGLIQRLEEKKSAILASGVPDSDYYTARICMNGHIICSAIEAKPELNFTYCEACGANTITKCVDCGHNIRGILYEPGFIQKDYSLSSFCYNCGNSFPWVKLRIEAANELAEMLDGLTEEEKNNLKKSINEIISDTPKTTVAANRFKILVAKTGVSMAQGFREILIDIICETAKRIIWPDKS